MKRKDPGDTFDDVVVELLDAHEPTHEPPISTSKFGLFDAA